MTEVPKGLSRAHSWYPHEDAITAAVAQPRFMNIDDYLDRYLIRIKEVGRKPRSGEFLTWFFDDDAKARERERISERRGVSGTNDVGVPLSWDV